MIKGSEKRTDKIFLDRWSPRANLNRRFAKARFAFRQEPVKGSV